MLESAYLYVCMSILIYLSVQYEYLSLAFQHKYSCIHLHINMRQLLLHITVFVGQKVLTHPSPSALVTLVDDLTQNFGSQVLADLRATGLDFNFYGILFTMKLRDLSFNLAQIRYPGPSEGLKMRCKDDGWAHFSYFGYDQVVCFWDKVRIGCV